MKISQKTIEEIFNTAIIEDVISDFVNLKKSGANYKGLSPFNEEKTPSFVVSPAKAIWKDFSSGKGGNVVSFLMEHEQYTYPEALLFLAKKYNIDVQYLETDAKSQEKENTRQAILIILNFVKNIFSEKLAKDTSGALQYLKDRGFLESTLEKFEIGYAPKGDHKIVEEVKKAGYNINYLNQIGIINKDQKNRFGGRIIFPIHGITGEVLGFGGRILDNNIKAAKYLNSDSSNLYQKSKILYGMHIAKYAIKKQDFCYVVEGYTDVIALFQFGIKNVVSSCGTSLTQEQIRLIHRFTNSITILFDSDDAGVNATIKAIDSILMEGMHPKILQLPKGEDPASFIQVQDKNYVEQYINKNTIDFIEFKQKLIVSDDANQALNKINDIMYSISLITDPISRTFYIRRASKKLNIKEDDLRTSLQNITAKSKKGVRTPPRRLVNKDYNNNLIDVAKNNPEELQLIRLLVNYDSDQKITINNKDINLAEFVILELERDNKDLNINFSTPVFNKIFLEIKKLIKFNKPFSKDYFLNHNELEFRNLSSDLVGEKHLLSNWEDKDIQVVQEKDILSKVTKESILRFKLKRIQEIIKKILIQLKNQSDVDHEDLIQKFSQLSRIEKKIQHALGRIL